MDGQVSGQRMQRKSRKRQAVRKRQSSREEAEAVLHEIESNEKQRNSDRYIESVSLQMTFLGLLGRSSWPHKRSRRRAGESGMLPPSRINSRTGR